MRQVSDRALDHGHEEKGRVHGRDQPDKGLAPPGLVPLPLGGRTRPGSGQGRVRAGGFALAAEDAGEPRAAGLEAFHAQGVVAAVAGAAPAAGAILSHPEAPGREISCQAGHEALRADGAGRGRVFGSGSFPRTRATHMAASMGCAYPEPASRRSTTSRDSG